MENSWDVKSHQWWEFANNIDTCQHWKFPLFILTTTAMTNALIEIGLQDQYWRVFNRILLINCELHCLQLASTDLKYVLIVLLRNKKTPFFAVSEAVDFCFCGSAKVTEEILNYELIGINTKYSSQMVNFFQYFGVLFKIPIFCTILFSTFMLCLVMMQWFTRQFNNQRFTQSFTDNITNNSD